MTKTKRPEVMATRHMVVAGHPLAAQAGFQILEAGGNAIDAGVAVGLAINVLESEMTCFGGVAPSMIRMGATGSVHSMPRIFTNITADWCRKEFLTPSCPPPPISG